MFTKSTQLSSVQFSSVQFSSNQQCWLCNSFSDSHCRPQFLFHILVECTEANCPASNSVRNCRAPFSFHSSQTAQGKHNAELSSAFDGSDEGKINGGTSMMCADVVAEERAESCVCDLLLLYGEQYAWEIDGGSCRIGMFSTGEHSGNMWRIGRGDFPEAECFRVRLSFWPEWQVDVSLLSWLPVGAPSHISITLAGGDSGVGTNVRPSNIAEWEDVVRGEVEELWLIAELRLWGSICSVSEQGGGRMKVGTGETVEGRGEKWDTLGGLTGAHECWGVDEAGGVSILGVFCWKIH